MNKLDIQTNINGKLFFMNKEIKVVSIIKVFNLAKIEYLDSESPFIVDLNALSTKPDLTKTISLGILGGKRDDT